MVKRRKTGDQKLNKMALEDLLENTNVKNLEAPPLRKESLFIEPNLNDSDWEKIKENFDTDLFSRDLFTYTHAIVMLSQVKYVAPEKLPYLMVMNPEDFYEAHIKRQYKNLQIRCQTINRDDTLQYASSFLRLAELATAVKLLYPPDTSSEGDEKLFEYFKDTISKGLVKELPRAKILFPRRLEELPALGNTMVRKEDVKDYYTFIGLYNPSHQPMSSSRIVDIFENWSEQSSYIKLFYPDIVPDSSTLVKQHATMFMESKLEELRKNDNDNRFFFDSWFNLHVLNAGNAFIDNNGIICLEDSKQKQENTIPPIPVVKK